MADDKEEVYGPEEEPLEHKADRKRKENSKLDNYENKNPFTRENMKELTGEGKATWKKVDDTLTDFIPLMVGFLGAKGIKGTQARKNARLKSEIDAQNFSWIPDNILREVSDGTVITGTHNPLSRTLYKAYDGKKVTKELEKAFEPLLKKYGKDGLTKEHLYKLYEKGLKGELKDYANGDYPVIDDVLKINKKFEKKIPLTKSALEKVDFNGEKGNIKITSKDKALLKAPAMIEGASIASGLDSLERARQRFEQRRPDEGALKPSGLPSISELLEGLNLSYNKKEAIRETNKIFDYIMENGDEEQLKRAYEIYGNTNFDKKGEAISALKAMVSLID